MNPVLTRLALDVLPPIVYSLLTYTVLRPFSDIRYHRIFLEAIGGSSEDVPLTQFIGDALLAVQIKLVVYTLVGDDGQDVSREHLEIGYEVVFPVFIVKIIQSEQPLHYQH